MKVRLLNNGCYPVLSEVTFPVEVEGEYTFRRELVEVPASELIRIGGNWYHRHGSLCFRLGTECELVTPTP